MEAHVCMRLQRVDPRCYIIILCDYVKMLLLEGACAVCVHVLFDVHVIHYWNRIRASGQE